ncbi:hypothetical protein [Oerskovia sp. KBS0722]|uniref:hypothetical protein n=1 Tax=Oerskovia sp. KBS0722 TaxID=1179673 RepID=UPI00110ED33A|nr:hypothetical protein [Oerskovia sp. KBS0722]QDW62334.1 hypothetical protein FFI11_007120 [Oerskovia sp. KBS0722]
MATRPSDESETMADSAFPRTSDRRETRARDESKAGALALTGAVIAWGLALIHLVNGFTRPLGLVDVRVVDAAKVTGAAEVGNDQVGVTAVLGEIMPWTDVYLHRPLDKIDLIAFFALAGVALFLTYVLARRGPRGARAVLEGTVTARWLGIALVAVGVVPALAQEQGTLVRLADAGLSDVLAPAYPDLGGGWIVAGIGVTFVVPALRKASRRGRD